MDRLKKHTSSHAPDSPFSVELSKGERYTSEGSIVNVSSYDSNVGHPSLSVYCMSKAAIDELTKSMAVELSPHRVFCHFN